jgi:transposase InsO family protein
MPNLLNRFNPFFNHLLSMFERTFLHLTQPSRHSLALSIVSDLPRSKTQLIAENALLRQQLIILHRQIQKPHFTQSDRLWLVLLASRVQNWKDTLLLLKPDTLLRWHRQGFQLFWKFKSRSRGGRPRLSNETITLIQQIAKDNLLWGAERIHGELLKLDIKVATATIQKYMRKARPLRTPSQTWAVFLKNHAKDVWACDFLPVIDRFFLQTYLFFIVELASRRIVHFSITAHPTDDWVVQQLREATPFGQVPRFLIRDRDSKYGQTFTRVAAGNGIEILKTPYRAPKANAICERFLGSIRRECLDHLPILGQSHFYRVVKEYVTFFNQARPHQGIERRIPEGTRAVGEEQGRRGLLISGNLMADHL